MLICIGNAAHHKIVLHDCNSFKRIDMTIIIQRRALLRCIN